MNALYSLIPRAKPTSSLFSFRDKSPLPPEDRRFWIKSFTCWPEMGYCTAIRNGIRHGCEAARRDNWVHDAGDEDPREP